MSANLIDFPPWRKSGGPLQDVAFLREDGILAAQPLQLIAGHGGRERAAAGVAGDCGIEQALSAFSIHLQFIL